MNSPYEQMAAEYCGKQNSNPRAEIDRLLTENAQLKDELRTLHKRLCAIRGAMQHLAEPESGDFATDYEVRQI